MSRTSRALAAGAAALLLVLSGCADGPPSSQQVEVPSSDVDVDTPELRAQKAEAGIEDCAPGTAASPYGETGLPQVSLPCLGGGPAVDLSELRGPLVVNLFAQWCAPCRKELPFYQRLHEEGKVDVLGIDYLDTQPAGALALAEATGVTFPLLADPDGVLRPEFRIRGLPGVLFVDESGRVVQVEFTVVRSYAQLRGLVREHLGVAV